jgi:hypothetical protein
MPGRFSETGKQKDRYFDKREQAEQFAEAFKAEVSGKNRVKLT